MWKPTSHNPVGPKACYRDSFTSFYKPVICVWFPQLSAQNHWSHRSMVALYTALTQSRVQKLNQKTISGWKQTSKTQNTKMNLREIFWALKHIQKLKIKKLVLKHVSLLLKSCIQRSWNMRTLPVTTGRNRAAVQFQSLKSVLGFPLWCRPCIYH